MRKIPNFANFVRTFILFEYPTKIRIIDMPQVGMSPGTKFLTSRLCSILLLCILPSFVLQHRWFPIKLCWLIDSLPSQAPMKQPLEFVSGDFNMYIFSSMAILRITHPIMGFPCCGAKRVAPNHHNTTNAMQLRTTQSTL